MMSHMIGELTDDERHPLRWGMGEVPGMLHSRLGWWNLIERECREVQKPDHGLLQCFCSDRIDHLRIVADF